MKQIINYHINSYKEKEQEKHIIIASKLIQGQYKSYSEYSHDCKAWELTYVDEADFNTSLNTPLKPYEDKMYIIHHCKTLFIGVLPTGREEKKYAGFVRAKSLREAYRKSQHVEGSDWDTSERSTSIGDMLQDGDDLYLVMPNGYKKLNEDFHVLCPECSKTYLEEGPVMSANCPNCHTEFNITGKNQVRYKETAKY